tara:strand:- start:212 stop:532 length:321 start_codon:yes stop_codon:yes gene_type:complete
MFVLFHPLIGCCAEIIQINATNDIVIGDQNRKLSITLPCIEVENENEKVAIQILNKSFPRGTKIKIKPFSLNESILTAKVFRVDDKSEMSQILISNKLATNSCDDI